MTTRLARWFVPIFAVLIVACGDAQTESEHTGSTTPNAANTTQTPTADGITMTIGTKERVSGVYFNADAAMTIKFDLAKVDEDVFADVTGNGGRPIVHVETHGDDYEFSYMGGGLTLHTTKTFIAKARAQAETTPDGVSTDGFAFNGDMHVLDEMLAMPEVAHLPLLSRALGVRGYTGSEFPATLVLHKMGRQSADALGITLQKLDTPASTNAYCSAYPNGGDSCYGMCGPSCSCWSWVCGDCCYHHGCAVHDSWCRQGKWWFCYNITAVIALFGC